MDKQLCLSSTHLDPLCFVGVRNSEEAAIIKKPARRTGLWTSTWREDTQDSEWVEWCVGNEYGNPYGQHWTLLTPNEDTRLYVIDGLVDLLELLKNYPWVTPSQQQTNEAMGYLNRTFNAISGSYTNTFYAYIDFERLAKNYDGLHLTSRGNIETHLSFPHNLNGWDCESTVWFRWAFREMQVYRSPGTAQ